MPTMRRLWKRVDQAFAERLAAERDAAIARVAEAEALLREVRRHYLPSGDDYTTQEDERAVRLINAFLGASDQQESQESEPA